MNRRRWVAFFEMILATLIWGFGFIATVWSMESFSPFASTMLRFLCGFLLTLPLFLLVPAFRPTFNRAHLQMALIPGLFLGMMMILQTWGLEMTTPTKSGFITTLYVVFVPIFEMWIFKKKLPGRHALWVALALIGTMLIVELQIKRFNFGDGLTLACAAFGAGHIISVGRVSPRVKSVISFNTFQSLWAGLLSFVFLLFSPGPHWKGFEAKAFWGILSLTVGSTIVAFALQVRAQKTLSPSVASVLFLLESPFSMMFSIWLLSEAVTGSQFLGAFLIFIASVGAVLRPHAKPS